jgi:four helix bundle protein
MDLAVDCYQDTKAIPREETFGLTGQIRRAAAAIPANIAEGHGRGSRKEYRQFLRTAQASLRELETHVMLSARVGLMKSPVSDRLLQLTDPLGRMLNTLQQRLRTPPPKS